jgi:hypothetical protein
VSSPEDQEKIKKDQENPLMRREVPGEFSCGGFIPLFAQDGALSGMRAKKWISLRGAIQKRYGPTFSV